MFKLLLDLKKKLLLATTALVILCALFSFFSDGGVSIIIIVYFLGLCYIPFGIYLGLDSFKLSLTLLVKRKDYLKSIFKFSAILSLFHFLIILIPIFIIFKATKHLGEVEFNIILVNLALRIHSLILLGLLIYFIFINLSKQNKPTFIIGLIVIILCIFLVPFINNCAVIFNNFLKGTINGHTYIFLGPINRLILIIILSVCLKSLILKSQAYK